MTTRDPAEKIHKESPRAETTVTVVAALASAVLADTLRREAPMAETRFRLLIEEFSPYMAIAFGTWCDEAIEAVTSITGDPTELLGSVYRAEARGDAARQWAGRMLQARAEDDKRTFLALIDEANTLTARERYDRARNMLATAATTIASVNHLIEVAGDRARAPRNRPRK